MFRGRGNVESQPALRDFRLSTCRGSIGDQLGGVRTCFSSICSKTCHRPTLKRRSASRSAWIGCYDLATAMRSGWSTSSAPAPGCRGSQARPAAFPDQLPHCCPTQGIKIIDQIKAIATTITGVALRHSGDGVVFERLQGDSDRHPHRFSSVGKRCWDRLTAEPRTITRLYIS
jgi:hypothetical protein